MKSIFLALIAIASIQISSAQQSVSGVVFADKNLNGTLDRGEKGVKGAAVTNGDTIVWCDKGGRYAIDLFESDYLTVILPDGYVNHCAGAQNGGVLTAHYSSTIDFALAPTERQKSYRVAIVGDPQVDNAQQFTYAQMAFSEISAREDLDAAILMGDLVNDNVEDLGQFSSMIGQMPMPVWSIIGNHDVTPQRTSSAFVQSIGADVTAFFRGQTCFVLINNVEGAGRDEISEQTFNFVRQIAEYMNDESLLVLCQHIPLGGHKQRQEMLNILGEQRTLILSAHAHTLFRHKWSNNISEVSVGALCGHWWTGERGADGRPTAIQQCGTPPNYFVFDFEDDHYSFSVQTVGEQASGGYIYWSGDIDFDSSVSGLSSLAARTIIANIYGSSSECTQVEWSLDRVLWHPMEHTEMIAPNVARLIYLNKEGDYPSNVSRRQPMRKLSSKQIWSATLPSSIPPGQYTIYVRASDSRGLNQVNLQRIVSINE